MGGITDRLLATTNATNVTVAGVLMLRTAYERMRGVFTKDDRPSDREMALFYNAALKDRDPPRHVFEAFNARLATYDIGNLAEEIRGMAEDQADLARAVSAPSRREPYINRPRGTSKLR